MHVTLKNDSSEKSVLDYLMREGITDAVIREADAGIEDRFLELMENGFKA
jgi:hypothetical protein